MAFGRSRRALILPFAVTLTVGTAAAQNENFLDRMFTGSQRQHQYVPQQAIPFADPSAVPYATRAPGRLSMPSSSGGGARVAYCVRLCDGRYFPIQRSANANPMQLCGALCPAAKTLVFNGSQIDHAYAGGGQRYADLDNAFMYRQRVVDNCSCNGKDSFGLARIDVAADPTRRPGDIIASGDNVRAALIAMHAAKERARDAVAERSALRGSRTATAEPPPRAPKALAEAAPSDASDGTPED